MPDREPVGDWDVQGRKIGGEDLVEAERTVSPCANEIGESADNDSGQALECTDCP